MVVVDPSLLLLLLLLVICWTASFVRRISYCYDCDCDWDDVVGVVTHVLDDKEDKEDKVVVVVVVVGNSSSRLVRICHKIVVVVVVGLVLGGSAYRGLGLVLDWERVEERMCVCVCVCVCVCGVSSLLAVVVVVS